MRAIIVDDERLARQELRRLLNEHPDVEIAGEARNANDAEDMLEKYDPDLVFLDIQMPGRSGLEIAGDLPQSSADHPHYSLRSVRRAWF